MSLSSKIVLFCGVLAFGSACSAGNGSRADPELRWRAELEGLYIAAKQVEASVSVNRSRAEPLTLASQEFIRRYLIADDWATQDSAHAVVKAYGQAIPF